MSDKIDNRLKFWLVSSGIVAVLLFGSLPALATTKLLNISIRAEKDRDFAELMQQAESIATESIDREFNQLEAVTAIEITIIGERNGQEVPLLLTKVSRLNWQARPVIRSWTNYFTKAAVLLGFNSPSKTKLNGPQSSINLSNRKSILESDPGFRDD